MDDLQEVIEDIIGLAQFALGSPWDADKLREFIGVMKGHARHALDLVLEEALCNPSPREEDSAPVLFEDATNEE